MEVPLLFGIDMPGSWGKRNETKRAFFNLIFFLLKSESHPKQDHWCLLNRNYIPFSSNCLLFHFLYPSLVNFFQSECPYSKQTDILSFFLIILQNHNP